jgi:hypothetical protein
MTPLTGAALTEQGLAVNVPFADFKVLKEVAFDGGAGSGAVGTVALFTVTGAVWVHVVGICSEDLTEAAPTATVEVGTAASTAALIAQTNATDIDDGEVWFDASPAQIEVLTGVGGAFIAGGDDIILTVGARNVDDGTITFACFWTPLTAGSNVVAA